jgi:hypothetical protein
MNPREQWTAAVALASRLDRVGDQPLTAGEVRARVETEPVESLREAERLDQERIGGELKGRGGSDPRVRPDS